MNKFYFIKSVIIILNSLLEVKMFRWRGQQLLWLLILAAQHVAVSIIVIYRIVLKTAFRGYKNEKFSDYKQDVLKKIVVILLFLFYF